MRYYEIKVSLFLKKDIVYKDIHQFLSLNLNRAMLEEKKLKKLHSLNKYKPYSFSSLFPFDIKTKIYKSNQIYMLIIRSIDLEFLKSLSDILKNIKTLDFNVLSIEFINKKFEYHEKFHTRTSSIITITQENKKSVNWTKEKASLEFVKKRIKDNLEKKYFEFFKEKIVAPDDFIQMIKIKNNKPIVFNYKKTKLFTNKFEIFFNNDEVSQKLAFIAFTVGILEKSSLGFGFLTKVK